MAAASISHSTPTHAYQRADAPHGAPATQPRPHHAAADPFDRFDASCTAGARSPVGSRRVAQAYGYVCAGLGVTAGVGMAAFRAGLPAVAMAHPTAYCAATAVGALGALVATAATSSERTVLKHVSWLTFSAVMGLSLCPLGALGAPVVLPALLGTAAVTGGLSAVAYLAPSDTFMRLEGPLLVGLGAMVALSFGQLAFPSLLASTAMRSAGAYLGLGLFSLFTVADTQRMLHRAQTEARFSPIDESLNVYLNMMNVFVHLVQIFADDT